MLVIFRRGGNAPRPTRVEIGAVLRRIAIVVRKPRPLLVALFVPERAGRRSAFYRLPLCPSAVVNNPAALRLSGPGGDDVPESESWIAIGGLVVPDDGATNTAENVRLFIKNHLGPLVDPADVAVVRVSGPPDPDTRGW